MERERLVSVIERVSDGRMSADGVADIILSELAAEKPTAPAGLVEELREWEGTIGITISEDDWRLFEEILSRYSARKEVVLGEGHLVQFIDQTGRPSYFCARRHEGKRGKLIFVEEDSK